MEAMTSSLLAIPVFAIVVLLIVYLVRATY